MKTLVILSVLMLPPISAQAAKVFVGVLEEAQCKRTEELSARVLFTKELDVWKPFVDPKNKTSLDFSEIEWVVAFDGRNLGVIKIADPNPGQTFINPWFYKRDKQFQVTAPDEVPRVKNKPGAFAGWCGAPKHRPLILVSKSNFKDPERWKPFKPNNSYKRRLFLPLKLVIGRFNALKCPSPYENNTVPYDFRPDELVLYKSYRSSTGRELVGIGLDINKIGCDGPPSPEWSGNWFLVTGDNLEFIGREMTLVDSGDYDADGKSELIFWHSGYNRDGYIIIYNDLREKAEYIWGYH